MAIDNYLDAIEADYDLFEIYTTNPETVESGSHTYLPGECGGYDIKWILAPNREVIKQYPLFDCIISVNDNSTGQVRRAEIFNGENHERN